MLTTQAICGQSKLKRQQHSLYVKLERSVDRDSSVLLNVQEKFSVSFVRQELLSKVLRSNFYKVETNAMDVSELNTLHMFLKEQKGVLYTSLYEQRFIEPPNDIPPTTTDFISSQGYLEADPGVNAIYAWANGANGSGITVRAIEYGLDVDHEEFVGRSVKIANGMTISSEASFFYTTHGTATAGVVYSHNGTYGTKGIAYNAATYILYPEWQEGMSWNRIDAITNAVNDANEGDIIIYEMQINDPNGAYVPAEYDQLVWDLTKTATDKGVVVVAAAGNGAVNLDDGLYDTYNARGDSGAIIVGAGTSTTNHDTHSASTFGTRVDVQAWGENVFSTGYGDIQFANDVHQYYTDSFSGTSSATAIIGGCVTVLQSYYYSLTNSYMTSVEMRDLLIDTGIPQVNMSSPIGPFPNLEKAMDQIDSSLSIQDEEHVKFSIFPNPAEDALTIKLLENEPRLMVLYDVLGKELLREVIDKELNTIPIRSLSSGIYYVKIQFNSTTVSKKIIKK